MEDEPLPDPLALPTAPPPPPPEPAASGRPERTTPFLLVSLPACGSESFGMLGRGDVLVVYWGSSMPRPGLSIDMPSGVRAVDEPLVPLPVPLSVNAAEVLGRSVKARRSA